FTSCRLAPNALLRASCFWRSSGTSLVGAGASEIVGCNHGGNITLNLSIEPGQAAMSVVLGSVICVESAGSTSDPLAPRETGTILHESQHCVLLEGTASRFPVSSVDFTTLGWPRDAAWRLVWEHADLDVSPMVGLRLYVNERNQMVCEALQGGGPPGPAIRSA